MSRKKNPLDLFTGLFTDASAKGITVKRSSGDFVAATPYPTSGKDVLLVSDEGTVKIEPAANEEHTAIVYYKTKNGLWISKGALRGRHYNDHDCPFPEMKCRTTMPEVNDGWHHEKVIFNGENINAICIDNEMEITFGDAGKCFVAQFNNPAKQVESYAIMTLTKKA